ncbi:hypothetical protein FRC06_002948 [Ceratobasidium sp. 370]|nr:hypothetical protein FRC06_002948 [Ceratobasidium sp. 370]
MMHSIYGITTDSLNDQFMLKIKVAMDNLSKAYFLVNVFPALARIPDWFPGTGWKRTAREWREQKDDTIDGPYNWTKSEMEKDVHEPSMIESMLAHAERLGLNPSEADDYVKEITFALVGGGTDTTANAVLVFFVAMLLFPKTQAKAQEEIDRAIGTQRLPTMEDRDQLPYIGRLIQEVLRWRPIAPIGKLVRLNLGDDVYKGYRIPKGAIVIGNAWAMSHNAAVYKDPETFEPDRFLDPSVPFSSTFGFGRRLCPGMDFAGSSLFIFIASILATFKIEMAKDEQGNDVVPVPDGTNRIVYYPVPFKLRITPRSSVHEQLIRGGV